jgi:hypothetical protein
MVLSRILLAVVYVKIGDRKKAREIAEEAYNTSKRKNGSTHPLTLDCKETG